MATLTHKCPHCLTEHIALQVRAGLDLGNYHATVHLDCPKCSMPSCAVLDARSPNYLPVQEWLHHPVDLMNENWMVKALWPASPGPMVPEDLPPDVARIYLQAERNFPMLGNEEAAGTMYRKSLDVGLKKIDAAATGTLAARIKKLTASGKLTADIADWADHVRDLGNEAAHEEAPPTREQLTDLRNITEMVLRYLFSMPALVMARKPKTDREA